MAALAEPLTILRARPGRRRDEPYGPLIRAIGPTLRALPDDDLADRLGPARLGSRPPPARPRATGSSRAGPGPATGASPPPERRQARTLEGILGVLGRLGEHQPGRAGPRGPPSRRRRDPGARHVPGPDRARPAAGDHRHVPAGRGHARRPVAGGPRRDRVRPAAARRGSTLPPLDRDELAALIEGIEGERASASLLLLVAERSGGMPLVAEELLAARRELPSSSLTGSFDDLVIARLALRSLECRRVLRLIALAGRPLSRLQLAAVAAAFEVGTRPVGAALGERPASAATACSDADLLAGRAEALDHGFIVETEEVDRDPPRADRPGGRATTSCRSRGRATTPRWRWPRRTAVGRRAATGWRPTSRAGARAAAIEAAGVRRRPARRGRRARRARARAVAVRTCPRPAGRGDRRRSAPSDRVDLQVRASEAAFAIGRTARATAYLEAAIGALDARERSRPARPAPRTAGVSPAGGRRPRRGDDGGPPRRRARARADATPGAGHGPRRARPAEDARRDLLRCPAARPRGDPGRARVRPGRADSQEVHATTTLGVALAWGSDPDAAIDLLREAEVGATRARRPGRAVPGLRQPDDGPRPRRPAGRGGRRRLRGRSRTPAGRARGGLRQLPAGNAAESLFLLGRWPEARALSAPGARVAARRGRLPGGRRSSAGGRRDRDRRRRGGGPAARPDPARARRAVREPQLAGPYYLAAASFALWRGDIADASRSVDRGWASVRETEDWVLVAQMAATVAQVDAAAAAEARDRRQLAPLAAARQRTADVLARGDRDRPRPAARPTTAGRGRWPRRTWPRPAPTSAGWRATTTPALGAVAEAWDDARRPVRGRAGALAPGRGDLGAARDGPAGRRPRSRCWPPRRSRSGSTRGRSCASFASSPAGRGSACRRGRRAPRRRSRAGRHRDRRSAARPRRPTAGRGRRSAVGPRPGRRRRSARRAPPGRHVRAERPGARGPGARRPGPDQPGDRRAPVHQPEDRRRPRRQHPGQAGGVRPGRGRRGRRSAWA